MKRLGLLFASLFLGVSLIACGQKDEKKVESPEQQQATTNTSSSAESNVSVADVNNENNAVSNDDANNAAPNDDANNATPNDAAQENTNAQTE